MKIRFAFTVLFFFFTTAFSLKAQTARVSVSSTNAEANNDCYDGVMSQDGHLTAFYSAANTLIPNDTNNVSDIFLRNSISQTTELVSVAMGGIQGNGASYNPTISANGRFVTFTSLASNLVPNDTNDKQDVFIRDLTTGVTSLVSVTQWGAPGNGGSGVPYGESGTNPVSNDGRFVAFVSDALNLAGRDKNDCRDLFVRDLVQQNTKRVATSNGNQTNYPPEGTLSMSQDGQFVTFSSGATNLIAHDTNQANDIFLYNTGTGSIERVSGRPNRNQSNGGSYEPALSGDGRYVSFASDATNLIAGDTNTLRDIFVYDRVSATTTRVNTDCSGGQANDMSSSPSISSNGAYIAYMSFATNLVPEGTNGYPNIFIRNVGGGSTALASVNSQGTRGNGSSLFPSLSGSGQYVTFHGDATNLVSNDTNNYYDVFQRLLF